MLTDLPWSQPISLRRPPDQRQREAKYRTASGAVFSRNLTPVGLDDSARDRQSETGAVLFRRVECIEDLAEFVLRDACPGITYRHLNCRFSQQRRSNGQHASVWSHGDHRDPYRSSQGSI